MSDTGRRLDCEQEKQAKDIVWIKGLGNMRSYRVYG